MESAAVNTGLFIRVKNQNFEVPLYFYQLFEQNKDSYTERDWDHLFCVLTEIRTVSEWFEAGTIVGLRGGLGGLTLAHLRNRF
jgi:hypothetical protein